MRLFSSTPIAAALVAALLTVSAVPAVAGPADISKVVGNTSVAANSHSGDISNVNGSIRLQQQSRTGKLTTVNGSITLAQQVSIEQAETVNGSIRGESHLQVARGLSTVNGSISLSEHSDIGGNISTVNGAINVDNSQVKGAISTLNGNISLTGDSHIGGDIVFKAKQKRKSWFGRDTSTPPTLTIAAGVKLDGKIILDQEVTLQLANPALQQQVEIRYGK
ncbi:hypothetical protein [Arsukibacterium sp.]|uniref:hypothetical protein n=1 Tax=Arsukibacterium sp. TaxID=1977258 RepID=UPI002FDB8ABD